MGQRHWASAVLAVAMVTSGCGRVAARPEGRSVQALGVAAERGRRIWFDNTYGGERFFAFLARHPDPARRIAIGFANVLNTPRSQRFQTWGTINDPDCRANPQGGPDLCADPAATGVVGIRQSVAPDGSRLYGVTCASCHAGFDPVHPPRDVAEPRWENIHPTIGNQYLKSGKIFAANLAPTDPRRIMFAAWPDGTVDTTALFNDNIMNPGVITAFWEHRHRPLFDVGLDEPKMRNGQGGEDDLGGDVAALRVYTNLGVCFAECVAPRPDRPDPAAPIDLAQCRRDCPDLPPPQDLADLVVFLRAQTAPRLPDAPSDGARFARGRAVFGEQCASCHTPTGEEGRVLSNDEVNALGADPANATNRCRARSTNWEAGRIWAAFSSQVYKDRIASGGRGYRTMPLAGIWATAPLLHNQSIGSWAPGDATPAERAASFEAAMWELLAAVRAPKVNRLPVALGPFPAGTPLTFVFSRDPSSGALLCDDAVENRGHHYGASLADDDKAALIYWLRFQ